MNKDRFIGVVKNDSFPPFSPVIIHKNGEDKGKYEETTLESLSIPERKKFHSIVQQMTKRK